MSDTSIWEAMAAAPWVAAFLYHVQRRHHRWLARCSALAFAWIVLVVAMRTFEVGFTNLIANSLVPAVAVGAFVFLLFASLSIPQLGCFPILALGVVGVAYLLLFGLFAFLPGGMDGSGVDAQQVGPNLVCESSRWIASFNHTGTLVELYRTLPPAGLLKTRVGSISQDDGEDTPVASCSAVLELFRRRQASLAAGSRRPKPSDG